MPGDWLVAFALVVLLLLLFCFFMFHVLCLALATWIVSLPNRTFLRACGCSILNGIAFFAITLFLGFVFGPFGWVLGVLLSFFLSAGIIAAVYESSYGRGFGAAIISGVPLTLVDLVAFLRVLTFL